MLTKLPLIIAFAGAALAGATSAQAFSVTYHAGASATNLMGTHIIEDFEGYNNGDSFGGGLQVQSPPSNGTGAVPAFGSTGNFLSVQNIVGPGGQNTSSVTFPTSSTQVLSFVIGSLDSFNRVILHFLNGPDLTLDGAAIVQPFGTPADGNQAAPATNGRVFYDTQGTNAITGVSFQSLGTAFEIDNISIAAPEPATWGMMIVAVGMAGATLRHRRRQSALA